MKIFEDNLKEAFNKILEKQKEERKIKYNLKDDFLEKIKKVFENKIKK